MGQKIGRRPQTQLCGDALRYRFIPRQEQSRRGIFCRPDFHRAQPVGADAHIGPPGSGSGAVRRTHIPPLHRRGGLYIRPEPSASTTGPAYIAPGSGRAMRAPTMCAFGDGASDAAARADMKSAPTDPLRGCRRGGLYGRPRPGPNSRRGSMVPPAALTAPSQTTKNPADGSAGFGFKRGIRAQPAPWPSGRRRRRPRCRHRRRSHRRRPG